MFPTSAAKLLHTSPYGDLAKPAVSGILLEAQGPKRARHGQIWTPGMSAKQW